MTEAADRALRIVEIETFGRGGLIHYAYNLAGALAERGHRVDLLTAAGCELSGQPMPKGMQLKEVVGRRAQRLAGRRPGALDRLGLKAEALFDARTVARLAAALEPDLIHLHNTNTSAIGYLSALKRTGIPLVATSHVVTPHERIALQDLIYRRIHGLPDLLIAHSQVDRNRLVTEFAVPMEQIEVIPHGDYGFFAGLAQSVQGGDSQAAEASSGDPDPAAGAESSGDSERAAARGRLGLDDTAPVALFFGYLRAYKGLDVLLDAWPQVLERVPEAQLVIAGDPVRLSDERQQALRRQAEAVGAVHRFEYIPMEEVAGYFAAADCLTLPYRHISQSGVLYLALSLGVPVVASAVGAWPEMLDDGENALLVAPGSVEALADAMARTLGDEALRMRLRAGGYALSEAHAWPAVAERTEQAFRKLLVKG